jgi:hypothetical protein
LQNRIAFIVAVIYSSYPETAYRLLEGMDAIVHNTTSVFDVVCVAKGTPQRYGKNGELLIAHDDTEGGKRRRSSVKPVTEGSVRM